MAHVHPYVPVYADVYGLLIAKEHIHILKQSLADLIPPYWQTLEFALSVAHRGQIPS